MPQINRLDVEGFRGVPQKGESLIFAKKSVLLFGENGTGKSSFVDAIEKLLCGRVATLDGRAQGISSDRQGPHIHAAASRPAISLAFCNPDFTYTLQTQPSGTPSALAPYLNAAREDLFILRRRDVLNFIDSQPRDRYAYLRPFLPLTGIQEVETAMKGALDKATSNAETAQARVSQAEDFITRPLDIVGEPTKENLAMAISGILSGAGFKPIAGFEEISNSLDSLDQELSKFGDTAVAGRLVNAVSAIKELLEGVSPDSLNGLIEACRKLRDREAAEAKIFYEDVIEDGIRWIREEGRSTCPLCENPIDPAATISNARARLESMRELIALRSQASVSLNHALAALRGMTALAGRAAKSLDAAELSADTVPARSVNALSATLARLEFEIEKGFGSLDLRALERSATGLQPNSPDMTSIADSMNTLQKNLNDLPSPDRAKQLLSARQRTNSVAESWSKLELLKSQYMSAKAEEELARTVYQRTLEARKERVQEIFDELSGDITRYYTRLHPDEDHGDIRLEVREAGQASAYLRGRFYEKKDEDPRGYYSDAHLDTLGISIFLALRQWHRKLRPDFNLLVLDDVLTSVDNAHAVRLSELLLKEFDGYQVLLTTHDRIWFEHFRDIQFKCGVAANYINKVIHEWTIEEGPDLREPEDERDRLGVLLKDGPAGDIASMAGRLLEHTLQEMRYNLALSIRAKRSERYEIGELWPPFYKRMRGDYPTFFAQAKSTLESLDLGWTIRNWIGGHFNDWARRASRADAVQFGQAVAALFDAVYCKRCRKFISPSNAPIGQLSCPHGELLYPAPGRQGSVAAGRAKLVEQSDGALRDARFDTNLYFQEKRSETAREQ